MRPHISIRDVGITFWFLWVGWFGIWTELHIIFMPFIKISWIFTHAPSVFHYMYVCMLCVFMLQSTNIIEPFEIVDCCTWMNCTCVKMTMKKPLRQWNTKKSTDYFTNQFHVLFHVLAVFFFFRVSTVCTFIT